MARTAERGTTPAPGGATLDFERQLWAMADAFAELGECRVHGGLHKLEPKELANLPIGTLLDQLQLRTERWQQPTLV
jgi:hypothetical protein